MTSLQFSHRLCATVLSTAALCVLSPTPFAATSSSVARVPAMASGSGPMASDGRTLPTALGPFSITVKSTVAAVDAPTFASTVSMHAPEAAPSTEDLAPSEAIRPNAVEELQTQAGAALASLPLDRQDALLRNGPKSIEVRVYRITPNAMSLITSETLSVASGHVATAAKTTSVAFLRATQPDDTAQPEFTPSTLTVGQRFGVVWFERGVVGPAVDIAAVDSGVLRWERSSVTAGSLSPTTAGVLNAPRLWIQETRQVLSLDAKVHLVMTVAPGPTHPAYDAFVVGTPESFATFSTARLSRAVLSGQGL